MAKLAFTKLGLKKNEEVFNIVFNNQNIEVKKYLSIQDKLDIIGNAINTLFKVVTSFNIKIEIQFSIIFDMQMKSIVNLTFLLSSFLKA